MMNTMFESNKLNEMNLLALELLTMDCTNNNS